MDPDTYLHYLRIFHSPCISVTIFSRLLSEFRTVDRLLNASASRFRELGLCNTQIEALLNIRHCARTQLKIDGDLNWCTHPKNTIVCFESQYYPVLLREIDTAPPILYVRGKLTSLATTHFSIVGSRKASIYGRRNAYWMAQELSAVGLQICSGLAMGVDTQAHKGALDRAGSTTAVMGTGADRLYPSANRDLAEQICENGALVSEFSLDTPPLAHNFPRRNRIISGMSLGTLVVEANSRSGSLITARFALEQNREVFAFPGPISSQQSRGCHRLIKQGAKLVEQAIDILEELGQGEYLKAESSIGSGAEQTNTQKKSITDDMLLNSIGSDGCLFQSILEDTQLDIQELNLQLMQLEMAGSIRLEGGRYYRQSQGPPA